MAAASPEYRLDPSSLQNIFVQVKGGKMAPIAEFVSLKQIVGPANIEHFNLFQNITCYITTGSGYTEGDAHKAIAEVFKETMPNTATFEYSGMLSSMSSAPFSFTSSWPRFTTRGSLRGPCCSACRSA